VPAFAPFALFVATLAGAYPYRFTIASIQIGAKGDVQPFDTG
jgi:hypothetical protein